MPCFLVSFSVRIDVPQLSCPVQTHNQPHFRHPLPMAAPLVATTYRRAYLSRESLRPQDGNRIDFVVFLFQLVFPESLGMNLWVYSIRELSLFP